MDVSVSGPDDVRALTAGGASTLPAVSAAPSAPRSAQPIVGGGALSPAEQSRRHDLLQGLIADRDLDGLIVVANDYRGHKGTLRWVTDYNLAHRHGFAFVPRGREPELILPQNMQQGFSSQGWKTPRALRAARRAGRRQRDRRAAGPRAGRHRRASARSCASPTPSCSSAASPPPSSSTSRWTSSSSARRSPPRSSPECASRPTSSSAASRALLEIARPGITEREIGAEMYRTMYLLGGEDPLFLSMSGVRQADGTVAPAWNPPRDRVLHVGDQFVFSFELIGPLGYWMEFARAVVFGTPPTTRCD